MEELLRVGEKLGKSTAENPLGANPDAQPQSPFDFFAGAAAPQPAGGLPQGAGMGPGPQGGTTPPKNHSYT